MVISGPGADCCLQPLPRCCCRRWVCLTGLPIGCPLLTPYSPLQLGLDSPVGSEQRPAQPDVFFSPLGADRNVVAPSPGDSPVFCQRLQHIGTIAHIARINAPLNVGGDAFATGESMLFSWGWLHSAGAVWIVGPRPSMRVVPVVAQRIEQPLMPRWRGI